MNYFSTVLAAGRTQVDAERAAVARIGAIHAVTGRAELLSRPSAALVRRTAMAGSLIGGVALVAYAVSAGISWALAAIRGGQFVIAPFPPGSYTAADCARWLAGDPSTHSCATAMTSDHVAEIIGGGIIAGFLGLMALLSFWIMRRRWQDRSTLIALPVGSAEAVGAILALLVAAVGAGTAIDIETVERGNRRRAAHRDRQRRPVRRCVLRRAPLSRRPDCRVVRPRVDSAAGRRRGNRP